MKYYVEYVSNGALQVNKITEHDTLDAAKVKYFDVCKSLTAETSVKKATVVILDEQFDLVDGKYKETIAHEINA